MEPFLWAGYVNDGYAGAATELPPEHKINIVQADDHIAASAFALDRDAIGEIHIHALWGWALALACRVFDGLCQLVRDFVTSDLRGSRAWGAAVFGMAPPTSTTLASFPTAVSR